MTSEISKRADGGLRRKALALASILAIVSLAVGAFFGDRGFLHLAEERRRATALRREIDALRAENSRLAADIAALRSDPRAIERIAREELGLVRPGELVFLLPESSSSDR